MASLICVNAYASQQNPCQGLRIYEKIGQNHPFVVTEDDGRERHSTILHISGKTRNNGLHHVWFLIKSIEATKENIAVAATNHTTKKLIYNNKNLQLVGKKAECANQIEHSLLQKNEYYNTIVPRPIIWAEKHETDYTTGLNTDKMLATDETEKFCATLRKEYKKGTVLIKAIRHQADRCSMTLDGHKNIEIDCLPSSKYPMDIYFDLTTLPNSFDDTTGKTSLPLANAQPTCPKCQAISSTTSSFPVSISNKIIAFGFLSLIAAAIIHHFFDISIQVTLKK